jgi:phosphoglycolate phosphatase
MGSERARGEAPHVDAVIFDLDGTLVDSLEDIARALDLAMDDHGIARPTRAHVREMIGGGARHLVQQAVGAERTDSVLARFRVHYAATPVLHTKLYDGFDAVLDQLASASKKLAVLSNKPHALTTRICDVLLQRWPFTCVIGQRDHVPLKPAPDAAFEVAAAIGVAPAACAFVGDSGVDVMTAHNAGMFAVGVTWGFRPREELVASKAALICDRPAELATLSGTRAS